MRIPLFDRIMAKVSPEPNTGCFLWMGALDQHGYGQIHKDGHTRSAYRVLYELVKGPIPQGLELDHVCRERLCVNPQHLEPVTRKENLTRSPLSWQIHRNKTHCPAGHSYSARNTFRVKRHGQIIGRRCRICMSAAGKRWREKVKQNVKTD